MPDLDDEYLIACYDDPVFFIEAHLGCRLWPKQREIAWAVRDYRSTGVYACHASGKTFVSAAIVLWWACTRIPSLAFTTAPTFRQVELALWREINKLYHGARKRGAPMPGQMRATELLISSVHRAIGFSTDEPDRMQGLHEQNILGLFDEASGVKPPMYEAMHGNLSAGNARLLMIGNPLDSLSVFAKECKSSVVHAISISAFDTPNFTAFGITLDDIRTGAWERKFDPSRAPFANELVLPTYAAEQLALYGENSIPFVARVLGQFPDMGTDALIPYHKIVAARDRWLRYHENPDTAEVTPAPPCVIGNDVADSGDDLSVRAIREGGYVHPLRTAKFDEPMPTANKIMADIDEFRRHGHARVDVKVDAIGIGSGVASRLTERGHQAHRIIAGARAHDRRAYFNLKAEAYAGLRQWFMDDAIAIPDDAMLMEELSVLKVRYTEDGRLRLQEKAEIKKMLGRSPDRAEALMLAFAKHGTVGIADAQDEREHRGMPGTSALDAEEAREYAINAMLDAWGGR